MTETRSILTRIAHIVPDTIAALRSVQLEPRPREGETLAEYLAGVGIENFGAEEVLNMRRAGLIVDAPSREWWPRIVPTLRLAEKLRERLGHPLVIGNGYRPEPYNSMVGGSKKSQHVQFRALDIDLPSSHNERRHRRALYLEAARLYRDHGEALRVGFGIYSRTGGPRVHLDTGWRKRSWGPKGEVRKLLDEVNRQDSPS